MKGEEAQKQTASSQAQFDETYTPIKDVATQRKSKARVIKKSRVEETLELEDGFYQYFHEFFIFTTWLKLIVNLSDDFTYRNRDRCE